MKTIGLRSKLLKYSIAVSLGLTLLLSYAVITYDQDSYADRLRRELIKFQRTNQRFFSTMAWTMNYEAINSFIRQEINQDWLDQISIQDSRGDVLMKSGPDPGPGSVVRKFDLTFRHNDKLFVIGRVILSARPPRLAELAADRAPSLLVTNGLLCLVIFSTFYFFFQRNVLSRLIDVANFTKGTKNREQAYAVYTPPRKYAPDEISLLIDALNDRAHWIEREFSRRIKAEEDLEAKNALLLKEVEERRQAEINLTASEERFRDIVLTMADCVWEIDDDNRFTYISDQIGSLIGRSAEDLIGRTPFDFVIESEAAATLDDFQKTKKLGGRVKDVEKTFQVGDGSFRYLLVSGTPVRDSTGRLIGYRGVATDVTRQKEQEAEKAEMESRLRQSQKMEALGAMAGGIAHDFNNILAAIIGYSELALEDAAAGRSGADHIHQVIKAGRRAGELVNQILAFSRKMEPVLKPVDLNLVIDQAVKMLERTIPKMVRIELDLAADLKQVKADQAQMIQVLMNLGANASDAMPEGGWLTVRTANAILDQSFRSRWPEAVPGEYVRLTVSDTGQGMDQDILDHIYDPFFTNKEVGKGTGLGLSTVYGIIKTHGGLINCDSRPNQGTAFSIYLPASRRVEQTDEAEPAPETRPGRETILLVDDEKAIRSMGRTMLTRNGYKVLTAESGEQARRIYARRRDEISAVILDLNMPGMGGRKCFRELRKINPDVKVIISSGYSEKSDLNAELDDEAAGYLPKPFSRADMLSVVGKVIDA